MKEPIVIATSDTQLIQDLCIILAKSSYSLLIEKSKTKSLLKMLETRARFIMLDLDSLGESGFDFINVIKKTMPKIPIIALAKELPLDFIRKLAQFGIFYCAAKPVQHDEIEHVLEAIDRFYSRHTVSFVMN
jgi:DNA-binding NtrC family response regulator